ncbi:MAG: metallophosphoesterase [Bacilli bacterium]|nr:metallophosphoesterase [Bacilli bacterium]
MTTKQKELYELLKQEITLLDLAKYLNLSPKLAYNRVQTLKNQGYNVYRKDFSTGDIQFSIKNYLDDDSDENILYTLPNDNFLRVVVLSDAHIGNSLQRLDFLEKTYNYCINNNIHTIFNCGDLLNGLLSSSRGSIIKKDYEKQINFFLKNYPFDSRIINFTILGNHDRDFYNGGFDLKQLLNMKRFDIKVLGYEDSSIKIKNDKIRLIHPIDKNFGTFANNSKIIFRGHSHESKIKTVGGDNMICSYVPSSCDMFYRDGYAYPGMFDVIILFNTKGIINEITINSLIYIDKFVKVGEFCRGLLAPEQYNSVKYEETPKKLHKKRK